MPYLLGPNGRGENCGSGHSQGQERNPRSGRTAKAADAAEEADGPGRGTGEERRGRRERPGLELGSGHALLGRVDEVADRELVAGQLVVRHLDVVVEELVADLLEAVGFHAARVADLRS